MEKAFAYLRVSGLGQLEGDGFPRQRAAIKAYSASKGFRIVREFEERGVTGKNDLENRPALKDLIAALRSNGTRVVLIEKLDCLARDLMIQESIIADLRKSGFKLVSVMEPDLCSDDPTRVLLRQMMGAFAQYERAMIVTKLRAARQRAKASKGRCEGRKPYGSRPGEREVIERMFAIHKQGVSMTAVHQQLNAEGRKPRYQEAWSQAMVVRIMKREAKNVGQVSRSTVRSNRLLRELKENQNDRVPAYK